MRKIVEYSIISAKDPQEVEEAVRAALEGGWQPFGGISRADEGTPYYDTYFAQAMVKYEELPVKEEK